MHTMMIVGRGGQGAKTLGDLLARVLFTEGFYVVAYPQYGPERTGAPVFVYLRWDTNKITTKESIDEPEFLVKIASIDVDVEASEVWDLSKRTKEIAKQLNVKFVNLIALGMLLKKLGIKVEDAFKFVKEKFGEQGILQIKAGYEGV